MSDFVRQHQTTCNFKGNESWVILSPIEQSIKNKIESVGTPLKDWDINIYRGVLTGCNEAFIISTEKRNEILNNCATEEERRRTEELIRPILRGRDIKRYGYNWANLWLIYIPWHFPYQFDESIQGASEKAERAFQEQYPAVYEHLLQYKEPLSNRNKAETGIRYEWYAMQRWGAKYWDDFYKPKIFYADITQKLNFVLCEEVMFCNNTTYFMVANGNIALPALQKYLNSKLIDWYYRTLSVQLGEKAVRMFSIYVLNIPIPKSLEDDVYEAYHLTNEEKDYIDKWGC